jgi:hypothetical protein
LVSLTLALPGCSDPDDSELAEPEETNYWVAMVENLNSQGELIAYPDEVVYLTSTQDEEGISFSGLLTPSEVTATVTQDGSTSILEFEAVTPELIELDLVDEYKMTGKSVDGELRVILVRMREPEIHDNIVVPDSVSLVFSDADLEPPPTIALRKGGRGPVTKTTPVLPPPPPDVVFCGATVDDRFTVHRAPMAGQQKLLEINFGENAGRYPQKCASVGSASGSYWVTLENFGGNMSAEWWVSIGGRNAYWDGYPFAYNSKSYRVLLNIDPVAGTVKRGVCLYGDRVINDCQYFF